MPESTNASQLPRPRDEKTQSTEVLRQVALTALRRWWMVALPVGVVLAAIAAAIVFVKFEPRYRAAVLVRIKSYQPRIVFNDGVVSEDSHLFISTQRELMRSDLVLGQVVSQPEIASLPELRNLRDPVNYLAKKISISSIGNSELFEISFEGPNPVNGAKIVNSIWENFSQFHDSMETRSTDRVIELLQVERERHASNVDMLRGLVRALSEALTGKDPFAAVPEVSPDEPARNRLAFLQTELAKNTVDQVMHRSRITALQELAKRFPIEISDVAVDAAVAEHEDVLELTAAISEKRKTEQEILRNSALGEQDSAYQEISRHIIRQTEMLERTKKRIAEEIRSNVASQQDADLQRLNAQLVTAQIMEKALAEEYNHEMSQSQRVTGDTLELEFKRAELAQAESVHKLIAERIFELQTERRAPARIELWARAEAPTSPVEEMPFRNMVIASGAAFCVPLLLAIGWEYRLRRVSDIDQWKAHSTLPVLAEIARIPSYRVLRPNGSLGKPHSQDAHFFEEAIHGLRTRLMLSDSLQNMQVLAVTSAVSGEGKTSVASQLAFSFAHSTGKKVLLIDGDMRAPDLHKVFDVNRDPGLADVLQDAEPPAAIRTVSGDKLHLLSAGRPAVDTHALVGTPAMEKLIAQARQMYDLVIIDTPPVLAAYEALVLAKSADAVVLCVMRDASRFDQVATAYDKLVGAGIKPIGAVLSGVAKRTYAHSYGRYRYSTD